MSDKIERLEFDQLAPRVQHVLRARVERLGYLGEFFKCSGHQPDILAPFMEMTEALKAALPDRLTEVVALTVATMMGNKYELHQHERLSRKLGFGEDWVAAVEQISRDAPLMSSAERAVQQLAAALLERRGMGVSAELERVIEEIGAAQGVAIMFLVGRYVTHALIVNALELEPPVSSIFAEGVK
ncbi:carboxymuconolactone decarboxylase family protein [Brevundimonas guildfordensis]|uniref:Carboxymuconolactone decarboxylase family protein n=1 Tax=Brevundimonas guildfordensis TaxID=2762241 RepID=A0ABR8QWM8_9CAUL|nr:carboxymuconolactone decarboxylase family protein [Brevundimonas guildfordensis]MBD7939950.1 carboxymuconolactone decarboxylase family protein [Brevundimonas guildfordensis]